jgi:hypothetical protein
MKSTPDQEAVQLPTLREYLVTMSQTCDIRANAEEQNGLKILAEYLRGRAAAYRDILRQLDMDLFRA